MVNDVDQTLYQGNDCESQLFGYLRFFWVIWCFRVFVAHWIIVLSPKHKGKWQVKEWFAEIYGSF